MLRQRKEIYFPLEIKPREFVSRVFLGGVMAQNGYRAYIGGKVPLNTAVLSKPTRSGVYFYKSTRGKSSTDEIVKKVDAFCALDEEMGIAVADLEAGFSYRLKGLERVSRFFTISEHVAAAARKVRPDCADRISATGWPKVDTWRPDFAGVHDETAKTYRARFGEFVLFSSDFGTLTRERIEIEDERSVAAGRDEATRARFRRGSERAFAEFEQFCADLKAYDALDHAPLLIVRPHPAEDHHIWRDRFAAAKRIKIVYEGSVSAWVRACRMMVHRGCTTGVEARIGNVPTFYWEGMDTSPHYHTLPYLLSAQIASLSQICDHWSNPQAAMQALEIPGHMLEFGPTLASTRIAAEIDALGISASEPLPVGLQLRAKLARRTLRKRLRNAVEPALAAMGIRTGHHLKQNKRQAGLSVSETSHYLRHFFPDRKYRVTELAPELITFECMD